MKANLKQILIITFIALIGIALFFAGYKTSKQTRTPEKATTKGDFDIEKYLLSEVEKLSISNKKSFNSLKTNLDNPDNLEQIAAIWDSANVPMLSAYFTQKIALKNSNELNWFIAGSKFYNAASFTADSVSGFWAINQAKKAYSKALEINPNNLQAKNALAVCIIQADNDVMKGVGMLKEVVATDSNNIQAIFTLGMLSIQSNQLDKAAERFEKLVKIEPFNAEYYFYLGEVYAKSGNTEKAIKTYQTCKTLLTDKEAKKEIDNLINKLNKI